jgi:hypothetical protein
VFYVIRHKDNIKFKKIRAKELSENNHPHLLKDEAIELTGTVSKNKYPKQLRRIAIWDEKNEQVIELIINHMSCSTNPISELYKSRW